MLSPKSAVFIISTKTETKAVHFAIAAAFPCKRPMKGSKKWIRAVVDRGVSKCSSDEMSHGFN